MRHSFSGRRVFGVLAGTLWAFAVASGIVLLWRYSSTPGVLAAPPSAWPSESTILQTPGRSTIVMMAHPRCPCTRASIAELGVLMTRVGDRARAHVLFLRPKGAVADWEKTALWQSAAAIPGVTVHSDVAGVESARFDASTSGQTVVYDSGGRLLFRGGITGARGHEGDNVGLDRIVSLVRSGRADAEQSSVFGCPLNDESEVGVLVRQGKL
jgi:hypothetical protein